MFIGAGYRMLPSLFLALIAARLPAQTFVPSTGGLHVELREAAKHRPPVRSVRCLNGKDPNLDFVNTFYLWLTVDPEGHVLAAKPADPFAPCAAEAQRAAFTIHYTPFLQSGRPVTARVHEVIRISPPEEKPRPAVPFPAIDDADPSKLSFQLTRHLCLGECPSYTVTITGAGKVLYHGGSSVSIPGDHVDQVEPAKVAALLERFRHANFFGLRDKYAASYYDGVTYDISARVGDREKKVIDYDGYLDGMPTIVKELEEAIDEAADSARWLTSSPGSFDAMKSAGIDFHSFQAIIILRSAIVQGDMATVRSLLAVGTPLTAAKFPPQPVRDPYRQQSVPELAVLSKGDRPQMLQTLLSVPAVRDDHDGIQQALGTAAELGDLDMALALIKAGADPSIRLAGRYNKKDKNNTYLMLAATSGVSSMLEDALSRPHDIHAANTYGETALLYLTHGANQHEDIFPLADRLLAEGATTSDLDQILLKNCHQPTWIPALIARGANPNARGSGGETPIFNHCTLPGVQALLDAGADPTLRNSQGKTALESAYRPSRDGIENPAATLIRQWLASHPKARQ